MKLSLIRRITACVIAIVATSVLISCNTTAGLGRDVEKAGHGIHRAAERAR